MTKLDYLEGALKGGPSPEALAVMTELAQADIIGWYLQDPGEQYLLPSPELWASPTPAGIEKLSPRAREAAAVMHYGLEEARSLLELLHALPNHEKIWRIVIDWYLAKTYITWTIEYEAAEARFGAREDAPGEPYRPHRPAKRRR
jgi:hypothetical protein